LQTGLIDGAVHTPDAGLTSHYYEVAKYFYAIEPIRPDIGGIAFSKKAFDALPKDLQDKLMEATQEHEQFWREKVMPHWSDYTPGPGGNMSSPEALEALKDEGVQVLRIPELQQLLSEQAIIAMQEWANKTGPKAQKAVEVVLESRDKFPASELPYWKELPEQELQ